MAEKIMVMLDVTEVARKYRALEAEFTQKAEVFYEAIRGARFSLKTSQEKTGEYGILVGKATTYGFVAEHFEHLIKAREEGRI
jgi:hypothetical protein